MDIELVLADAEKQQKVFLEVPDAATIAEVLNAAGIVLAPGEAVGVFAEIKTFDTVLQVGDRLEIYRPLLLDPKLKRQAKVDKTTLPRRCR